MTYRIKQKCVDGPSDTAQCHLALGMTTSNRNT